MRGPSVTRSEQSHLQYFRDNPEQSDLHNKMYGIGGVCREGIWKFWLTGDAQQSVLGDQAFTLAGLKDLRGMIDEVLTAVGEV